MENPLIHDKFIEYLSSHSISIDTMLRLRTKANTWFRLNRSNRATIDRLYANAEQFYSEIVSHPSKALHTHTQTPTTFLPKYKIVDVSGKYNKLEFFQPAYIKVRLYEFLESNPVGTTTIVDTSILNAISDAILHPAFYEYHSKNIVNNDTDPVLAGTVASFIEFIASTQLNAEDTTKSKRHIANNWFKKQIRDKRNASKFLEPCTEAALKFYTKLKNSPINSEFKLKYSNTVIPAKHRIQVEIKIFLQKFFRYNVNSNKIRIQQQVSNPKRKYSLNANASSKRAKLTLSQADQSETELEGSVTELESLPEFVEQRVNSSNFHFTQHQVFDDTGEYSEQFNLSDFF